MVNKKTIIPAAVIAAAAVVIVILAVIFIRQDYNSSKYNATLYFYNETSTALTSETREIKYRDGYDLAENVINELMSGPSDGKNVRIIEKNTKLLSIDGIETGSVTVNFSREFLTGDNTKDILAVYAVVKSLCTIGGIDEVKVVIEGKDISTSSGSIIGFLGNSDINLSTDIYTSEMREVVLYFPKKGENKLIKETRSIRVTDQQPLAQYIIHELIKGPVNETLSTALSSDTVLLSVETSDNICFVNFKSSFLDKNSGSAEKEKMVIYSIVDSLTELDSINRVQFLMDGKKIDNFGNINIGSMFGRDESMIEK